MSVVSPCVGESHNYCIFEINDSRAFMLEWNHNTNIRERRKINRLSPLDRTLTSEAGLIMTRPPK